MTPTHIPFVKMSGSGNDFILIDNRRRIVEETDLKAWVTAVCRRKHAVGADGLILIEASDRADFKWRFFNADGGEAEMCGNGGRCVARWACLQGIAPPTLSFETLAGVIRAEVKEKRVKLELPGPLGVHMDYALAVDGGEVTVSHVNVGVPHVVIWTDDIETVPISDLGPAIRYHTRYAPAGTNVNFIEPLADGTLAIRTYERGVEDETLACGTGSVGSALIAAEKGRAHSPATLITRGGETLRVYFERRETGYHNVFLEGDARVIYEGRLWDEAVG